jgi:MerR family transcriptional regulator/heat shock protein HspR
MEPAIIPRDEVAEKLAVSARLLLSYEARGLVHAEREGSVEGYRPAEIRRLWTILSCQQDLGINLAGVEAVLKLRDHLADVHRRLDTLSHRLREILEAELENQRDG